METTCYSICIEGRREHIFYGSTSLPIKNGEISLPDAFAWILNEDTVLIPQRDRHRFLTLCQKDALRRHAYPVSFQSGVLHIQRELCEYAGITGRAIILGAGKLIEIWKPEHLNDYLRLTKDEVIDF